MPIASCMSQTWCQRAQKWGNEGCKNRVDEGCKNGVDEGHKDGPKGGRMVTTDILSLKPVIWGTSFGRVTNPHPDPPLTVPTHS